MICLGGKVKLNLELSIFQRLVISANWFYLEVTAKQINSEKNQLTGITDLSEATGKAAAT